MIVYPSADFITGLFGVEFFIVALYLIHSTEQNNRPTAHTAQHLHQIPVNEEKSMTFHCKNYDIENDKCKKLSGECIPARKGCVLEGRMVVSEELAEKIRKIDKETARRRTDPS